MSVFKEINKADGSGVTQFFRLSSEKQTVETHDYGDFYNFKGSVASESDLPTTQLKVGDTYFIEDEEKTVFWDGVQWLKIDARVLNYNYNDASNKPLINGHILQGNKTAADLELQPAGDYLTEIPSEYITEGELEDYNYATKTYVIEQVNNAEHFHREIVTGLPVIGKDNVIYMIKKVDAGEDDVYDEYMWVNTKYEHIGSTAADLTNYYKKGEVDSLLEEKVSVRNGFDLSSNDYTTAEKTKLASLENYDDGAIWGVVNTLHNYDDTEIKQAIADLESAESDLETDIEDLQNKTENKIEYIRLVKAGDTWTWMNVKGDTISFEQVRDALGLENTFLIIEDIENDGKMVPARYDIDEDVIHVWYTDISGENYEIYLSADTKRLDGLGIQPHYLPHANTLPESGKPGDMISIGSDRTWYVWEDNSWVIIDKGGSVDLSNYLAKDNTTGYAPTGNYNPATKKYVDDSVATIHVPTKLSQLTNDSGYILKTSNDLTHYYTKTNTYTKAEVNALIAGGYDLPIATAESLGGIRVGDNLTIDETGKLSAQAGGSGFEEVELVGTCYVYNTFTEEGTHVCLTTGEGTLLVPITTPSKQNTTMEIKAGALVIYTYQPETEEDESYFDLHIMANGYPDFYTRYEGIPKRSSTRFDDLNVDGDIYTIPKNTSAVLIKMAKKRVSITQGPATLTQCYIDDSEEKVDLELPGNTIIVCNPTELITKISDDAMIILPTGTIYRITVATVTYIKIETVSTSIRKYDVLNGGAYLPATGLDIDEVTVPISTDRVVSSGGLVKSFNDDNSITLNGWTGVVKIDVTYLCAMDTVNGGSAQLISSLRTNHLTPHPMQDGPTCITDTAQWQFPLFTYYLENTTGEEVTMHLTVMTTTECSGGMRLYGFAMQQL